MWGRRLDISISGHQMAKSAPTPSWKLLLLSRGSSHTPMGKPQRPPISSGPSRGHCNGRRVVTVDAALSTSSQAGLTTTVSGIGAYSVAKFGVTALCEQLRTEMAPHGVGVSCLCPGYVQTNLGANTIKIGGEVRKYSDYMPPVTIGPADVGLMVADAIEQNAAYIITHKDVWPGVEKRMNEIKAACDYRIAH